MRSSNAARTRRRLGKAFLIAVGLVQILAMKAGVAKDKPAIPLSVPDDWTHHHVIFSGARSQADANRLQHNPRYWHQWLRHNLQTGTGPEAAAARILNDPNYMSSLAANARFTSRQSETQNIRTRGDCNILLSAGQVRHRRGPPAMAVAVLG